MNTSDSSSPSSCCSGSPSCTAALVLGIIALVLALIGFFPCLGWITLIPAGLLAIIALIMSIVAVSKGSPKGALVVAIIALALSAVAGVRRHHPLHSEFRYITCLPKHPIHSEPFPFPVAKFV